MRRRTFDILMSAAGGVITVALLVAASLAFVGYRYANDNVTQQLSDQNITFPEAGSESLADERIGPYLTKYAGQTLTTGAQAQAYADHYIKVHISDLGEGATKGLSYAELGPLVRADPENTALAAQRDTVFKGETLRGLLLNAYAWWKLGQIALWGSIGAFGLAGVMAILSIFGFIHARRVGPESEVFAKPLQRAS